eukprot:COSAG02_NODE_575_length_20117_cov_5.801139_8_plen_332_part_00
MQSMVALRADDAKQEAKRRATEQEVERRVASRKKQKPTQGLHHLGRFLIRPAAKRLNPFEAARLAAKQKAEKEAAAAVALKRKEEEEAVELDSEDSEDDFEDAPTQAWTQTHIQDAQARARALAQAQAEAQSAAQAQVEARAQVNAHACTQAYSVDDDYDHCQPSRQLGVGSNSAQNREPDPAPKWLKQLLLPQPSLHLPDLTAADLLHLGSSIQGIDQATDEADILSDLATLQARLKGINPACWDLACYSTRAIDTIRGVSGHCSWPRATNPNVTLFSQSSSKCMPSRTDGLDAYIRVDNTVAPTGHWFVSRLRRTLDSGQLRGSSIRTI